MADDTRWTLTEEENRWASALKAALAEQGVPPPTTDFEIAHFALISKGDLKKGIQRVKNFNEHIVKGYPRAAKPDGDGALGFFNRKWPGALLACGAGPGGGPMMTVDVTPYLPGEMKDPSTPEGAKEWDDLMTECILLFYVCASDLDECRKGMSMIAQCRGMGWKNFSYELEKRAAVLYQDAIPCRFDMMLMVNGGYMLRAMVALCKLFLKKKLADRITTCTQPYLYEKLGFDAATLPPLLGGTCTATYETWAKTQLEKREVSKKKVKIAEIKPVEAI